MHGAIADARGDGCPDENDIVAFARGEELGHARARLEAHIDGCPACAALVAEAARLGSSHSVVRSTSVLPARPSPTQPSHDDHTPAPEQRAPGSTIGRYVVVDRLGMGGMGVVYRARDPELDRDVAVKVVRRRAGGDARAPERLLREARLMAQLSHPNVVEVFEVGMSEGDLFVAMELVHGDNLRRWNERGPHTIEEIVAVFVQAARGLAAAHCAGVIHRDFKPDNVIVSHDGRARVMDFGLARVAADPADSVEGAAATLASRSLTETALTESGTVMGTPAYMAPEQHTSGDVDGRCDQFALCASLFEAVYGRMPYRAKTLAQLAEHKALARIAVVHGRGVPRWLRQLLRRGLAPQPDERYPSMDALADALARRRVRARDLAIPLFATATLAAVVFAADREPCAIASPWSEERRAAVRGAFDGTHAAYAADAFAGVDRALHSWADAWRTARASACEHAIERGDDGDDDASIACLEQQRAHASALVEVLATADVDVVGRAVRAVSSLPDPRACEIRRADAPLDPGAAARATEIRATIARAAALGAAGRSDEALALAEDAVARADELGLPALRAEALIRRGRLLDATSAFPAAERSLAEAYFAAGEANRDDLSADAAIDLIGVVGTALSRTEDAATWSRHARTALGRLPEHDTLRESRILRGEGSAAMSAGRYEESLALVEQARALREPELPSDHVELADYASNAGNALMFLGRYDESIASHERALTIRRAALGDRHPHVGDTYNNLGAAWFNRGDYDRAEENHRKALATWQTAHGNEHHDVAMSHSNLAGVHHARGEHEQALVSYRQALSIWRGIIADDHPDVAHVLNNIGTVLHAQREYDDAIATFREALAIRERLLGPEHPDVAVTLANYGTVLLDSGRVAEAERELSRALVVLERAVGRDHPDVASTVDNIGLCRLRLGDPAGAAALHERALAARIATLDPGHAKIDESRRNLEQARAAIRAAAASSATGSR